MAEAEQQPIDQPEQGVETANETAGKTEEMTSTNEGGYTVESNWTESIDAFHDMGLKKDLLKGVFNYGFEKPSAIQKRAIKPIVLGHDTIAQSQSGTGKTGTFSIASLEILDISKKTTQALILSPTRELAQQSANVVSQLGEFLGAKVHACVGGTAIRDDIATLQAGVHVVVGTPGRVFDMMNRRALSASEIKLFVLDEADEMLNRGFRDQIHEVFTLLPETVQVALFFCDHA